MISVNQSDCILKDFDIWYGVSNSMEALCKFAEILWVIKYEGLMFQTQVSLENYIGFISMYFRLVNV